MRRAIVGTAGHVDHGKTRLIEALTGIDCDRWDEEKRRGITIDLGFAHLTDDDLQLGFVDVPGHEGFLHNALAGIGCVRLVLLVVAADEGVQAQTREHLAICSLLGIPAALVAVTKADLVDPELADLAVLEVEELLAGTPFADAPTHVVSAITGSGIDALRRDLLELGRHHAVPKAAADPGRPARLPIDRAFHLTGLGPVVTGTLLSGRIGVGDELALLPTPDGAVAPRVRSVQVHGEERHTGLGGERVALQLGGVDLDGLERGQELVTPGAFETTHSLLVRLGWLPEAGDALGGWRPVRVHLHAAEVMGRVRAVEPEALEPGATGTAELRLEAPVVAVAGDRLVLRRPSPQLTVGGGEILDPRWHRRGAGERRRAADRLTGEREEALRLWVREAGEGGMTSAEAARRLGVPRDQIESELDELAEAGDLLEAAPASGPRRWVAPATLRRVSERAEEVLQRYFAENRLADSMPKAEALRRILSGSGRELAESYLRWLEAQEIVEVEEDRLWPAGHEVEMTSQESDLARRLRERYAAAGLTPPSPAEVCAELGAKPQICAGVTGHLIQTGDLVRLGGDLVVSRAAFDDMVADLRSSGWQRFGVGDFKERYDLTRKWAIPLLERLDSEGITRRIGDERMIVGAG